MGKQEPDYPLFNGEDAALQKKSALSEVLQKGSRMLCQKFDSPSGGTPRGAPRSTSGGSSRSGSSRILSGYARPWSPGPESHAGGRASAKRPSSSEVMQRSTFPGGKPGAP